MRSKPLEEAYAVAKAYVRHLDGMARETKRMDPRFNNAVQVIHQEGTQLFFHSAFAIRWGIWHIVIPEHHDIHIYAQDEANVIMFKRIDSEVQEITDLAALGISEAGLQWGPDPYGDLKRQAEEDAKLKTELEDSEADITP